MRVKTHDGRIKKLREEKLMTRYRLAEASGVSYSTIGQLETNSEERTARIETVEKIAAALGVRPSSLVAEIAAETAGRPSAKEEGYAASGAS